MDGNQGDLRGSSGSLSATGVKGQTERRRGECWTPIQTVKYCKPLYLGQYCVSVCYCGLDTMLVICSLKLAAGLYRTPYSRATGNYSVWT